LLVFTCKARPFFTKLFLFKIGRAYFKKTSKSKAKAKQKQSKSKAKAKQKQSKSKAKAKQKQSKSKAKA
jgi:hypothetical protein